MPSSIRYIDQIALEKNRDVLFLHFEAYVNEHFNQDLPRHQVMQWLDLHGIGYEPCMGFQQTDLMDVYTGDLYLDVPFDQHSAKFKELSEHFEDQQGNMIIEGVYFFVLELETVYSRLSELTEGSKHSTVYCFETDKLS